MWYSDKLLVKHNMSNVQWAGLVFQLTTRFWVTNETQLYHMLRIHIHTSHHFQHKQSGSTFCNDKNCTATLYCAHFSSKRNKSKSLHWLLSYPTITHHHQPHKLTSPPQLIVHCVPRSVPCLHILVFFTPNAWRSLFSPCRYQQTWIDRWKAWLRARVSI